ncbi:uncharacterized protein [Watersipora subatra]|uniref:uncharacterized protein n=1 Tax=Watersipora subatra TaxID=2589382 RepID=UPI00355AD9B4
MKRVVVIGAGAAGLAALRSLVSDSNKLHYVAYERSDKVGGTWILDDPYKPTSMYNQLRTNLPKEVMAFPGFPFSDKIYESFIGHKDVLDYLESFAQHYQLHKYIKFRHAVLEVDPVLGADGVTQWNVTEEDCETGVQSTQKFDSVIVCNGHYTEPLVPDIKGRTSFTGEIMHSHYYRSPIKYKGKVVLVFGSGPSGKEITAELLPHASKVYLSHNRIGTQFTPTHRQVLEVAGVDSITGDDIHLIDGSIVHADMIILTTGYRYAFPFLSAKCRPVIEDEHVSHIYQMLRDIKHPSLYYIGLNKALVPFPQFACQADYIVGCITGRIAQETQENMERSYQEKRDRTVKERGRLKLFHDMRAEQWPYNDQLAIASGMQTLPNWMKELDKRVLHQRKSNLRGYKNAVYRLSEDQKIITLNTATNLQS